MDYQTVASDDLAILCVDVNEAAAWQEFLRRCQRPVALTVLRICRQWGEPSAPLVDDLVQDTFLRLCAQECRLLKAFKPQFPDSVFSYLRLIAASVAHDHFRAEKSQKRGGLIHRVPIDDYAHTLLSSRGEREIEMGLQMSVIEAALASMPPGLVPDRDKTIFLLYYRQGFTCKAISAIATFELGVKGVESSIHRTTTLLRNSFAASQNTPASLPQKGLLRANPLSKQAP